MLKRQGGLVTVEDIEPTQPSKQAKAERPWEQSGKTGNENEFKKIPTLLAQSGQVTHKNR